MRYSMCYGNHLTMRELQRLSVQTRAWLTGSPGKVYQRTQRISPDHQEFTSTSPSGH